MSPARLRKVLSIAIGLALLIVLAASPAALARLKTIAPPGNSGVNQYVEVVPTAGGGRPSNTVHPTAPVGGQSGGGGSGGSSGSGAGGTGAGANGSGSSSVLSPSVGRRFARHGRAGAQAAALAQATAPSGVAGSGSITSAKPAGPTGSSPLVTLVHAATGSVGSNGLGSSLPILLLVVAVGGSAFGMRRRRRT